VIFLLENNLNEMVKRLKPSKTLEMLTLANKIEASGQKVIHMELGEPDVPSPASVKNATIAAIQEDFTHYTVVKGLFELREKILDYYSRAFGAKHYDPSSNIIITPGAKSAVFYTILTLLNQDDEVIIPTPMWGSYASMVRYVGAKPVFVDTYNHVNGVNIEDISAAITNKTKLIILNYPTNPTSGILANQDYKKYAEIISQNNNLFLLSDEIYSELTYNGKIFSFTSFKEIKDRTIVISGFSKSHSMTGYRLGYALGPKFLVDKFTALQGNGSTCAAAFVQKAGITALDEKEHIKKVRKIYNSRAKLVYDLLTEIPDVFMKQPEGAFYAYPKIEGVKDDFTLKFLQNKFVAGTPGSAFGPYYEDFIRLSFATNEENIREGINRLKEFTKEYRK
jgi:aspartate/methionine/tyrosine aminotransferase